MIVVPAFGDEMNKTRRMLTEAAIRLNEIGIAMLIPDLYGTGDSEGSFGDANWDSWVEDLRAVRSWASQEGFVPCGFIAIRTGALLAVQCSSMPGSPALDATVFWQPVRVGNTFVKQLLRLRTIANAVNAGARESVEGLAAKIIGGEAVLVGGYELTAAHIRSLMPLTIDKLDDSGLGARYIIEVTRAEERVGDFVETFGSQNVDGTRYMGEPYWSSAETVCDHNVVNRTVEFFRARAFIDA